ncbi:MULTISPECIES: HAMP domain-containing sensor histidine kinase [Paenibacillus]|uniref:histidine kinase n=1 Tax=Paenibacillus lactis 154 TaxID=743719 RepID=G4HAK7_9BACL|nr:HAMP domain-containing sensor histidine kinase [Paenibacillus lactis]EHB66966.1 integral membrane sensor signal transduction histidine kinase [Paenibacillus lactis 154]MCM3492570.1 HAMP domain-containing histidine kinase [Paenibacillus lactis]
MKSPNRLQRSLIRQYIFFFITIALIAAFSLFVLNAQMVNYFREASGPIKSVEAEVMGDPAAAPGVNSEQHEQEKVKVFYGMALKTLLLFLALFAIIVYAFGRWTASRVTTPLRSIADGIRSIARGHYHERLNFQASYELAQIQDDFNEMAARLEQIEKEKRELEESKQRMLMDISHDLKTPMTTLRGYIEAMEVGLVDSEERRAQILSMISNKASLMLELIDGIFELSKLDSPEYPFDVQTSDITEFTRAIAAEYYEVFEEHKFYFHYDIPDREIWIPFNATWLYRAVSNILSNALKYNPPGTTVGLKLAAAGNGVEIHLSDDGVGIPEDIQGKVFDAFVRGDLARKSDGGTGLGLAIAKQVIEKHGGTITLTTNGQTTFVLFLPEEM